MNNQTEWKTTKSTKKATKPKKRTKKVEKSRKRNEIKKIKNYELTEEVWLSLRIEEIDLATDCFSETFNTFIYKANSNYLFCQSFIR